MSDETDKDAMERRREAAAAMRTGAVRSERKYIAEHTVAEGETLSDISLKYYQSAIKEKWMKIYQANRVLIGDNPGMIKEGQVLKIPELEDEE